MAIIDNTIDPATTTAHIVAQLEKRYPDLDRDELRRVAAEVVAEFADAHLVRYLETVAEHRAREILRAR